MQGEALPRQPIRSLLLVVVVIAAVVLAGLLRTDGVVWLRKNMPDQYYHEARRKPPPDFDPKHPTKILRPRDLLRRDVYITDYLKCFRLRKDSIRRITQGARGPLLRHLFRVLKERPEALTRKKIKWTWDEVFFEHISGRLHKTDRANVTKVADMKRKLKKEFHNFVVKKLV
mmetsp:Transcript_26058/g.62768  ORF Transcript_26058/g.62768 Transcript_26058/m.62768 type:complete len:172 (+) Transcript_26058:191-706(+)